MPYAISTWYAQMNAWTRPAPATESYTIVLTIVVLDHDDFYKDAWVGSKQPNVCTLIRVNSIRCLLGVCADAWSASCQLNHP